MSSDSHRDWAFHFLQILKNSLALSSDVYSESMRIYTTTILPTYSNVIFLFVLQHVGLKYPTSILYLVYLHRWSRWTKRRTWTPLSSTSSTSCASSGSSSRAISRRSASWSTTCCSATFSATRLRRNLRPSHLPPPRPLLPTASPPAPTELRAALLLTI